MFHFKEKEYRKRVLVMCIGIIIMGLGNSLFRLSLTGNDPSSAFALALRDILHQQLRVTLIITGLVWFIPELIWGRHMIGLGTFVNWFGVGLLSDLWTSLFGKLFTVPDQLVVHICVMVIGVLVLSLSCALYQTANVGISPYDALALLLDEHLPLPYFWCRIIVDSTFALLAFLCGGLIGLGTLMCAVGLGPFISFFTKYVALKILPKTDGKR